MNTFNSILLIVILILIVSDVFFLWKILKNLDKKKKDLPDERYFELKYNINLLKAVSAILIFLIGFLGFNTYNNISENLNQNFTDKVKTQNKKIDSQNEKIDSLINLVIGYEESIKSLKVEEGESVKNLDEINQKFAIISEKLKNNQEVLKYTTKVYVVKGLKVMYDKDVNRFYFKDLKTFKNEELPKFKNTPLVVLQGRYAKINIYELNNDFIDIGSSTYTLNTDESNKEAEFDYFDMWIAEPN